MVQLFDLFESAGFSKVSTDLTGFGSPSSHKDSCCSLPPNFTTSPPMSPLPEIDMERDAMANSLDLTGNERARFSFYCNQCIDYHDLMTPLDCNTASFHTPSGTTRVSRPDFLDLSNSLVKKQRFMFTPPNDHPPSGFEERQAGDGQPEPPVVDQELEISEYLTPNRMGDSIREDCPRKSFSGSFCIRGEDVVDHSALGNTLEETMDEEFVSFQSNSTMERYAPQGLSDHDLSNRFSLCDNSGTNRGKDGLVKWKGIVLTPDEEYVEEAHLGLVKQFSHYTKLNAEINHFLLFFRFRRLNLTKDGIVDWDLVWALTVMGNW